MEFDPENQKFFQGNEFDLLYFDRMQKFQFYFIYNNYDYILNKYLKLIQ